MKKLNQEMIYLTKIIEIYSGVIDEDEIRLILFYKNQVVLSSTLNDLDKLMVVNKNDMNDYYPDKYLQEGSEYYLYKLHELFYKKTIGNEYKENNSNIKKSHYTNDSYELSNDEIRLILFEDNKLVLSKKFIELPVLLRRAYIDNIKLNIENIMEEDSGFVCINEYESWLKKMAECDYKISNINEKAVQLFEEINKFKE